MKARVVGCVLSVVVVLGVHNRGLLADPPNKEAPASTPAKGARPLITMQERIAMGVDEPTWVKEHGKVHPHVRAALKEQKELEKNLDKDPKASLAAIYQPNRPVGFLGFVYVVVHLEHKQQGKADSAENKAAIRQAQSSVLSKLTAAEFGRYFRFPDRPAILGWVNEQGLEKLAKNETVFAIGLDTKPRPKGDRPQFYSQGGENTGGGLPKVSAQVRAALKKVDEVSVIVNLQLDKAGDVLDEFKIARVVQDRVLSQLSAEEFRVIGRGTGAGFSGWITSAGLSKLAEDPDVAGVGLPGPPARIPVFRGTSPKGDWKNPPKSPASLPAAEGGKP